MDTKRYNSHATVLHLLCTCIYIVPYSDVSLWGRFDCNNTLLTTWDTEMSRTASEHIFMQMHMFGVSVSFRSICWSALFHKHNELYFFENSALNWERGAHGNIEIANGAFHATVIADWFPS